MTKEKESYIETYSITLPANAKGVIPIIPPSNKIINIGYIILNATAGSFSIQNESIKHLFQNVFIIRASTINQHLYLVPGAIVRESGSRFKIQNISAIKDSLDLTIVGDIE